MRSLQIFERKHNNHKILRLQIDEVKISGALIADRSDILSPKRRRRQIRTGNGADPTASRSLQYPVCPVLPLCHRELEYISNIRMGAKAKTIKGNTGKARQGRLLKRVGTVLCACVGVIVVAELVGYGRHSHGSRHRRRKG